MREESCFPSLRAVHYLLIERPNKTVAHCLDLDVVAVGPDLAVAVKKLNALVVAQIAVAIRTGNVLMLDHKAPQVYWDRWNKCTNVTKTTLVVPLLDPIPAEGRISVVEAACPALA